MTRKERAYSFMNFGINTANEKLHGVAKLEASDELLIGAFAGTALAAMTLLAVDKNISKQMVADKKALDETYTPIQRSWAEKLEKMNKDILIAKSVGSSLGSIAGWGLSVTLKDRRINETVGTSIGNRLGKAVAKVVIRKRIQEYKDLLLEYEDSLSYNQKVMRNKFMTSMTKVGLYWTIGCIGGFVLGASIGNKFKQNN